MKSCKTDRKVRFENPNPRFCFKKRHFASENICITNTIIHAINYLIRTEVKGQLLQLILQECMYYSRDKG